MVNRITLYVKHVANDKTCFLLCYPLFITVKSKAGTKRYMSPELLSKICTSAQFGHNSAPEYEETETDPILTPLMSSDESPFSMPSFEILKASDVYSFGLVLWELARRCRVQGGTLRTSNAFLI